MSGTPGNGYNDPVKDLSDEDLRFSSICKEDQDRGKANWRTKGGSPKCVFCRHQYRYGAFAVQCHLEILDARLDKNRVVEMLVRGHTNIVLREALNAALQEVLPWDIELDINEDPETDSV